MKVLPKLPFRNCDSASPKKTWVNSSERKAGKGWWGQKRLSTYTGWGKERASLFEGSSRVRGGWRGGAEREKGSTWLVLNRSGVLSHLCGLIANWER